MKLISNCRFDGKHLSTIWWITAAGQLVLKNFSFIKSLKMFIISNVSTRIAPKYGITILIIGKINKKGYRT